MRVAFVVSGGGAQGDFEVGALRYLTNQGIRPQIVCGTSVGSINGAAMAMGDGGLDLLEQIWLGLVKNSDMYADEPWLGNLDPAIRQAIFDDASSGGVSIDKMITGGLFGFVLFSPVLRVVEAAIAANIFTNLGNSLTAIKNAKALHNLGPISQKVQTVLLNNWLTMDPKSRKSICVAATGAGSLAVFIRDCFGSVQLIYETGNGWSAWVPLIGSLSQNASSNIAAGVHKDGTFEIFALGYAHDLWRATQTVQNWNDWVPFSPGWTFISNPAIGVNTDGNLEVFMLGTDRVVWHRVQQANDVWADWIPHDGGVRAKGDPVVAQDQDGRLEVFVIGMDGPVYHSWRQLDGGWSGWESLGMPGGNPPTSNLTVANDANLVLQAFVRGSDKAIWHIGQQGQNGGWGGSQWSSLGGFLTSDPAVARNQDGRLEVFACGADRALWHNWTTQGGGWFGWQTLQGTCTGDPVVGVNAAGEIEVFVKDLSNTLSHIQQSGADANNGWTGWDSLGGCIWPGIMLRIAVVSLLTGNLRYVDENGMFLDDFAEVVDLADAVMASSAIPTFFTAVKLTQFEWYVDGGVREVLPIQPALDAGADVVYAIEASRNDIDPASVSDDMIDIAKRVVFEIIPNEGVRKGTSPHPKGWGPNVHIIQPTFDVNDSVTIDPGLISIAMAYGFMRANDVVGPFQDPNAPPAVAQLSDQISSLRKDIWRAEFVANTATGRYMGGDALPGPDYDAMFAAWNSVRTWKTQLKNLVDQRIALGGVMPDGFSEWWNSWERHYWGWEGFPLTPDPWEQITLGNNFLPKVPPP